MAARDRRARSGQRAIADRDEMLSMWSTRVHSWPELETKLASCSRPFALDVVRHGQTEANAGHLFSGASDVPLSLLGEQQARELGSKLTGRYDLAFHSGLERSRRTLELALSSSPASVGALIEDGRLAERSLGALEGRPSMPISEYEQDDFAYAPQDGEPYASVAHRVLSFLADLACTADLRPEPLRALACTHVGPMRLLVPPLRRDIAGQGVLTAKYANAEVFAFEQARPTIPGFLRDALRRAGATDDDPAAAA